MLSEIIGRMEAAHSHNHLEWMAFKDEIISFSLNDREKHLLEENEQLKLKLKVVTQNNKSITIVNDNLKEAGKAKTKKITELQTARSNLKRAVALRDDKIDRLKRGLHVN
jgi:regulator of replication initiation timing